MSYTRGLGYCPNFIRTVQEKVRSKAKIKKKKIYFKEKINM